MTTFLETGDALRISGVDAVQWKNSIVRGGWHDAPASLGHTRYFDRDDVVALYVFGALTSMHMQPMHAARLASDVREMLREDPTLHHAYVVREHGKRAEVVKTVNHDQRRLDLQLAKWRGLVEHEMHLQTDTRSRSRRVAGRAGS